jgi:hypothetical protein
MLFKSATTYCRFACIFALKVEKRKLKTTMLNRVNCSCDPGFHRSVLYYPGPEGPFACMHCGAVTYSQVIGDDGRGGGRAWTENIVVDIPSEVLEWFAQLPRLAGVWGDEPARYFPADARFNSVADLSAAEQKMVQETEGWSRAQKIHAAGLTTNPPPPETAKLNPHYVYTWEALQLDASASIESVLRLAQHSDGLLDLLAEHFLNRPDINTLINSWLKDFQNDLYWYSRSSGDAYFVATDLMLRQENPAPENIAVLLKYLQTVSLQKSPYYDNELKATYRIEAALQVLEKHGPLPETIQVLQDFKKRIGKLAVRTKEHIEEVLEELMTK